MLNEINQSQNDNPVWFYLYEIPRVVKFVEEESRMMVARGWREGEMGS